MALLVANQGGGSAESLTIVGAGPDYAFDFNYGFNPVAGNLLCAVITRDSSNSINTPSGWVEVFTVPHSSARTSFFFHEAGASEPSLQQFTVLGNSKITGGICEVSGYNPANIINVFATAYLNQISQPAPSATTTAAGCLLITGTGTNNNPGVTLDANITPQWSEATTACATTGGTELVVSAGEVPAREHTLGSIDDGLTFAVLISPTPSTDIIMDANPGIFSFTAPSADTTSPSNSEPANAVFGAGIWTNGTWGVDTWWPTAQTIVMDANPGIFSFTAPDADTELTADTITMDADTGIFSFTAPDAFLGESQTVVMDADVGIFAFTANPVGITIAFPAVYQLPRLNVDEYGDVLRIDFGEDITANETLTFIIEPKHGNGKEKQTGVTVGNADITVANKKFRAGQYIEYTIEQGDLDYAGQWRMKGEAKMSSTKNIITDYTLFTVFE